MVQDWIHNDTRQSSEFKTIVRKELSNPHFKINPPPPPPPPFWVTPHFTTNSSERATSGKRTSPERLQWLFVPLLLFLLSHLIFTCPKLAQKYWRNLFYSAFFQWYCADFEQNNRYLKNVVGQFFPKQQLQKRYRIIF